MTFWDTVLACSIGGFVILTIQRLHKAFIVVNNTDCYLCCSLKEWLKAIVSIVLFGNMDLRGSSYREE
jgi:hypothetical protein